jgi:intron-binding protein aquarius
LALLALRASGKQQQQQSTPSPHFYQNLAEAEYATALFMYMRLQGYPADRITILSTYNGQKHLIRDVLRARSGTNPLIGWPAKVTTVDRYQGQQNDFVILSLVSACVLSLSVPPLSGP